MTLRRSGPKLKRSKASKPKRGARPSKHFLDTSVALKLFASSQRYKKYLRRTLPKQGLYVNNYVKMEYVRAHLKSLIDFYFILSLDSTPSLQDALHFVSNDFHTRRIKVVISCVPALIASREISFSAGGKPDALRAIGMYIKRLWGTFDEMLTNTGVDPARCARAEVLLKISPADIETGLMEFTNKFDDVVACRSKCRIDKFLLTMKREQLIAFVADAQRLTARTTSANREYIRIAGELEKMIQQGSSSCTCKQCSKIGDAVVSLQAPPTMQLEHLDHSFDHFCGVLQQPHRKLEPEIVPRLGKHG